MKPGDLFREAIEPHTVVMLLRIIEVPIISVDGQSVDMTQHAIFLSARGETEVPIHWCYNFMEPVDETR